ncbi:MAG: DNA mismatch repair endonuclease MutL [Glaciecola sp.]|nr:DNA mismatch repair endonuclease MutL [Glaciecola sp.]MDG1816577.1 DNA mismatch repair endonuclease MutL [Glaciecola sp.]MDG2098843.1 DNA mismatch repair endonuclease MutL [Glaciecola sp.]
MSIQILSAQLANQIAAGEVVERPASIVKELVENSIDAGATKIDISIEQGGQKRITITDNGSGIVQDELALALSRHATSKITSIEDLAQIASLGFRGEALASISSVARLTLTSKPAAQSEAWQVHCEGRDMDVIMNPAAHPDGSTVDVVDLFFNTPARRKFLKTHKTEFSHIDELIKRMALSHHEVAFKLTHNGKTIRQLPVQTIEKRIDAICGKGFIADCVAVEREYQGIKVCAWLTKPMVHRTQNDAQYTFVNGRMMRDKLINHAVRQAYEGLIDSQYYPGYVLFIDVPFTDVDVNVHPAKHEVRFVNSRVVHDFLYQSLVDVLNRSFTDNPVVNYDELTVEHDYIQPLARHTETASQSYSTPQSSSGSTRANIASASTYHTPRGQGAGVAKQAIANYESLIQPLSVQGSANQVSEQAGTMQTQVLVLAHPHNDYDLLIQTDTLLLCDSQCIVAKYLHQQMNASETQQPLLLPIASTVQVSAEDHAELITQFTQSQLLVEHHIAGNHAQKWLLKKVPSLLRSLPWSRLFVDMLEAAPFNTQDVFEQLTLSLSNIDSQYPSVRALAVHWFIGLTSQQQRHIVAEHTQPAQLQLCIKDS